MVTTTVTVDIPLRTARGQNAREHWGQRARRVKAEHEAVIPMVRTECNRAGINLSGRLVVTLTRVSAGTLDDDNNQGALKGVRDAVAIVIGTDDNDPRIEWRYGQERCKRGHYGVRVEIEGRTAK